MSPTSDPIPGGATVVAGSHAPTDVRSCLPPEGTRPGADTNIVTSAAAATAGPPVHGLRHGAEARHTGISFHFAADEADGAPLPPGTQHEFQADLHHDLERLEHWAAENRWLPLQLPPLQIVVSRKYRISRSLVPAWEGRAGSMEFPAWRVAARRSAIAHELVHVAFPNGNRLLAEGLAIYLQAEIGGNPAFPNFGRALHDVAIECMQAMKPAGTHQTSQAFDWVHLADLDKIATPGPLALTVGETAYGEEPRGQAHVYPIAGSFAQYLVEEFGIEKFRDLYRLTPLVPNECHAGSPDRWIGVYALSLAELAGRWRSCLSNRQAMSPA